MSNIPKSREISSVLTEKTSKSLVELTEPTKTYADRTVLEEATPRPNHQPISSSSQCSKLPTRGQLRNDIYSEKQLILYPRHGTAFAWILFNLLGHVWKEGENRGYKNPCFCRGRVHFALAAIG